MALDDFSPEQKKVYVVAATVIGLILSTSTTALRFFAKIYLRNGVYAEDWFIFGGLLLSYGIASSEFFGLTTGLGQHEASLSVAEKRNFQFRFQPPSIFCIKTSIIIFYARIFPTRSIQICAWGIWIYTMLWTIEAFLSSMLECIPVAYFWDKTLSGHCVANPLVRIGLTNGVLSTAGDIFILIMPMPLLVTLQMNSKRRFGLLAIFTVGILVIVTSFLRWIALLGTTTDVSYTQAEAGIWTFMEVALGITCANLPLLAPLLRTFSGGTTVGGKSSGQNSGSTPIQSNSYLSNSRARGFRRMENDRTGSEVELRPYNREGIVVNQEVEVSSYADGKSGLYEEHEWNTPGHCLDPSRKWRTAISVLNPYQSTNEVSAGIGGRCHNPGRLFGPSSIHWTVNSPFLRYAPPSEMFLFVMSAT
ncbi:hypothetical protein BX600DRAFT_435330 [Xylariales sp. PMI_506]|nr:hypothetical protein BX600DRAFT_435330 [Xylariales sp. PMI_506]